MSAEVKNKMDQSRIDKIAERMSNPQYSNQKYPKDSVCSIKGTVFADLVNMQDTNLQILQQVKKNLSAAMEVVDQLIEQNSVITLELAEQHMDHVDAGVTETYEVESEDLTSKELTEEPKEEKPELEK